MKQFSAWILIVLLFLGCVHGAAADPQHQGSALVQPSDLFSNRDFRTDNHEKAVVIQLNGDHAACGAKGVSISGSTITITAEGTYVISGTLQDGMIIVNTDKKDKVQLVLNGVSIHSKTSAPIYILQSDKVFITTAENTENSLSNGGEFIAMDDNDIDAVIFSKEDLTLNGTGLLLIQSPGGHGVVSKDSLTITGGSYDITCASHALAGKDDLCIADGSFTLTAGKDGLHAENNDDAEAGFLYIQNGVFHIAAEGDGISASAFLQIDGGSFEITTGGGSSNAEKDRSESWGSFGGRSRGRSSTRIVSNDADSTSLKGVKATGALQINGGSLSINSADDAIHSNVSVTVAGGTFAISSGDDAFHADESLTILDGTVTVTESYEGLEGHHILVSGGNIVLTATDDGLNAAGGQDGSGMTGGRDGRFGAGPSSRSDGSIIIAGGNLQITAYGDGLDANGTLDITGGCITVSGPSRGDTAILDYDLRATISGATFIGTGSSFMFQSFSQSEQGVIAANAGSQAAGTEVTLTDGQGNQLLRYTPPLDYAIIILSTPDLQIGSVYTITAGTATGELAAR